MITILFGAFVLLAMTVAFVDWRQAWLLAVLVGVLQDPARKLTSGAPVVLTMSIVAVYGMILLATFGRQRVEIAAFSRRFGRIWISFGAFFVFLLLAAFNGLMTFGLALYKAPLFSLFLYLAPLPAVMVGFMYLDREELLFRFFRFYSVVTSLALIGSLLEYLRVDWSALGLVSATGDYIRHIPGVQIRMISGFYRAPDIMGWHAATLTCIAIAMVVRDGITPRAWRWIVTAGWGFFNCMISGRRKAIYMIAVFAVVLLWRYFRRLKTAQVVGFAMVGLVLALVVHDLSSNARSSAYAIGAATTREEVSARLEGGMLLTIEQFGILGAGLGTATQGVYHVLRDNNAAVNPYDAASQNAPSGWQEAGLGKLTIELGVPGLIAAALLLFTALRTMLRITAYPDLPQTSQLGRVTLFALIVANIANFMASAQAYSDPVLTLITCFLVGCLFATARLDEVEPAKTAGAAASFVPASA
jgi:hypothetical protein